MAPLGEEWLIRGAASNVAADGHGSEGAAVVALAARDDAKSLGRARFEMELARKFDSRFGRFRASGGEVDAALGEIGRSEGEEAGGESFGGGGVELRRVGESDLGGLGGHGVGDGLDTMTDADDGGLTRSVEIFLAVGGEDPGAFTADSGGKGFLEIAGEEKGHGEKL